jgi:hypothetical protein
MADTLAYDETPEALAEPDEMFQHIIACESQDTLAYIESQDMTRSVEPDDSVGGAIEIA